MGKGVDVVYGNRNRIQKFSSTGLFLTMWQKEGTNDGQFDSPESITVDEQGNVYVADTYNQQDQKFTPGCSAEVGNRNSGRGTVQQNPMVLPLILQGVRT